jgi:hypothetical protein
MLYGSRATSVTMTKSGHCALIIRMARCTMPSGLYDSSAPSVFSSAGTYFESNASVGSRRRAAAKGMAGH